MSKTVFHYLCFAWRRHLAYALLSANSLIRRGQVDPQSIVASISERLIDSPEADAMHGLGVKLRKISNGFTQKLICVNEVFEQFGADTIIQLDSDTCLLQRCDLAETINSLAGKALIACYRGSPTGRQPWELRKRLLIDGYKPPGGTERLDAFMRAIFGFTLEDWESELTYWILGGLGVFRREIVGTPTWSAIQAMAWITRCDETPIRMAAFSCDPKIQLDLVLLYNPRFPHDVSPTRLSFDEGRGMVHWAGDWYREHNTINRQYIQEALQDQFGLRLPTDAPVGPFDRHAKTIPGEPVRVPGGSPRPSEGQKAP